MVLEPFLAFYTPGVISQLEAGWNDTVARNHNDKGVFSAGRAHCSHGSRFSCGMSQATIGKDVPVRNLFHGLPYTIGKRLLFYTERETDKTRPAPFEVFQKLIRALEEHLMGIGIGGFMVIGKRNIRDEGLSTTNTDRAERRSNDVSAMHRHVLAGKDYSCCATNEDVISCVTLACVGCRQFTTCQYTINERFFELLSRSILWKR